MVCNVCSSVVVSSRLLSWLFGATEVCCRARDLSGMSSRDVVWCDVMFCNLRSKVSVSSRLLSWLFEATAVCCRARDLSSMSSRDVV